MQNLFSSYLVFLLQDPKYFGVKHEHIGATISQIHYYSTPVNIGALIILSFVFDMVGRRAVIVLSFFANAIILFLTPYSAPSIYLLILLRLCMAVSVQPPFLSPMVTDYVKKESRGRATSLNSYGFVVGELIAFGAITRLTADLNIEIRYYVGALTQVIAGIAMLFLIKEPEMAKLQHAADQEFEERPLWERSKILIDDAWHAVTTNSILPVCMLAGPVVRLCYYINSTVILLWITSFVDDGYLESEKEAMAIFSKIQVISVSLAVLMFYQIGRFVDKVPSYVSCPVFFGGRALALALQFTLDKPDTWYCFFVVAFQVVMTNGENIATDGLFNKNLSKSTRGLLNGVYSVISSSLLGVFVFAVSRLYDSSHLSPFMIVITADLLVVLLFLLLRLRNKIDQ